MNLTDSFRKSLIFLACIFSYQIVAQTISPSSTENFIHVIEPISEFVTVDNQTPAIRTIQYFDGLGRQKQIINSKASGSGKDIVTKIEYDEFGRQKINYLPIPTPQTTGEFIETVNGSFYQDNYGESIWYSQKTYENSPLNRVIKQAAPGNDWAKGEGHEIEYQYQSNNSIEVKRFKVAFFENYEPSLVRNGNYEANQLFKTQIKDENGNTTIIFKNKQGQIILKRTPVTTYAAASKFNGPINIDSVFQNADTYYVYDDYGNLTYIIPPLASIKSAITTNVQNDLCYIYRYDESNRLVEKKLPGKRKEYIVYDKQDRLVAVQDEVMKNQNQWAFFKYDKFGRIVMNGLVIDSRTREQMQNLLNYNFGSNNAQYDAKGFMHDGLRVYYENDKGYPDLGFQILTVNYYDFYAPSRSIDGANFPNMPGVDIRDGSNTANESLRGILTSTVNRILGTSDFEKSYFFYDVKSRPVYTHKINHLGGYTKILNYLDFRGKPVSTVTYHKYDPNSTELKLQDNYTYDTQERLRNHNQIINSGQAQRISGNNYNEIGQLTYKLVGNSNSLPALQGVNYAYNIRGWLTGINNIEDDMHLRGLPGEPLDDIFAFKIQYNELVFGGENVVSKLYNGNISQIYWKTATDNVTRGYSNEYDQLNRLKIARFNRVTGANPPTGYYIGTFDESLAYDLNGNIKHLIRYTEDANGGISDMDDLQYTYKNGNGNTNQLAKVADNSNATSGFTDGTNLDDDYEYDLNGNMLFDKNKGITSITYNHLNLPTAIIWSSTKKIEFLYNSAGVKVQKKVTNGSAVYRTNYLDGFQYYNGILQFFHHPEGYVKQTTINNQMTFDYVFNYKDHLGNIRLSYAKDPATGELKILEENHYFPFGLRHKKYAQTTPKNILSNEAQTEKTILDIDPNNPVLNTYSNYDYKFQNQELQDELGLNWYSFKWRNYDPATGRFMSVDPLAESYPDWGPYVFSGNRVIDARELEGLEPEIMNGEEYGLGDMEDLFGVVDLEPATINKLDPEKYHEGYEDSFLGDFNVFGFLNWNNPYNDPYVAAAASGYYRALASSAAVQDMDRWIKEGISWIPGGGLVYYPEMKAAFQSGNYLDGGIYVAGALPFGFGNVGGKGFNVVSKTPSVLRHIFRNASGHVNPATITSQGRYINLFEKVANNPANLNPNVLSPAQQTINGIQGFSQTFRNGSQVWTHTFNGKIFDAGVNIVPK